MVFVSSKPAKAGENAAKSWASSPSSKSLRPFVATQDLLAFESENIRKDFISKYLGDESDQRLGSKSRPQWTKSSKERERESHWKLDKVYRCQSTFTKPGLNTAIVKLKPCEMNIRLSLLISKPPQWKRLIIGLQDLY